MIPEEERNEEEEAQQIQQYINQVKEEAKQEALSNLSAEQELSIAQGFIQKQGKRFLGSEGKYPFLSEAVNSEEEKLKRISNLQSWEIEKLKVYNKLSFFLESIGMLNFSKSVDNEKNEIMRLSTSRDGMLLGIAGTEAIMQKSIQRTEEDKNKK